LFLFPLQIHLLVFFSVHALHWWIGFFFTLVLVGCPFWILDFSEYRTLSAAGMTMVFADALLGSFWLREPCFADVLLKSC
jgi:hypothetical protein